MSCRPPLSGDGPDQGAATTGPLSTPTALPLTLSFRLWFRKSLQLPTLRMLLPEIGACTTPLIRAPPGISETAPPSPPSNSQLLLSPCPGPSPCPCSVANTSGDA